MRPYLCSGVPRYQPPTGYTWEQTRVSENPQLLITLGVMFAGLLIERLLTITFAGGGYDQQYGNGSRFSNVGGYYNQRGSHDNGGHPRRYQYNNARQHSDPALNRQNNTQG